ncbi:unnamed protein product [Lasius platythorax]|uniref:Uncharacterized protein n=1 Tax=Lasius platythorax TaxID=488582 RepID=A0AAV2NN86_9HYME
MSEIKIEPRASTSVSQPSSSFFEQQISEPSTSYRVLPPVQGGIEQSQFPNVPTMPYMSMEFQPSTSGWTHPYDVLSDASNSHASQQKGSQSFQEVFDVPTKPCMRVKPQPSTSGWQPLHDVPSHTSTSNAPLQGGSQPFHAVFAVPKSVRSHIREQIQNYLKLDGLLEPAAKEVLDENKDKIQVAQNYGLDLKDLKSKVYIMQRTRDYWKKKDNMEKAVKDVQNSPITLKTIAKNYDIYAFILRTEYNNSLRLKDNTSYEYDQLSANNCAVFTFMEESLLLQHLQFLKDVLQCPCQICALDFLLSLSYDFAQQTNKIHPSFPWPWSEHKEADCNWLF